MIPVSADGARAFDGPDAVDLVEFENAPGDLVRCGAELVELSERFYHGVFMVALSFLAISTTAALAFLPLRDSAPVAATPVRAVVAGLVVLILAAAAIRRARELYLLVRRHPALELVGVLIAALLMSVASPLRNELWWSAGAILAVIATLAPLRRALLYCLVVLAANLAAHLVAGDLRQTPTVAIAGLWIGLPFWTAMAAVIPERMAAHILCLNAARRSRSVPSLRVKAWVSENPVRESGSPRAVDADRPGAIADPPRPSTAAPPGGTPGGPPTGAVEPGRSEHSAVGRLGRLTSRQMQVVALLADGHRYRGIAECLSISPGQVHRHVRRAIDRLGVQSATELVAVAVAEGIVPGPFEVRRTTSRPGRGVATPGQSGRGESDRGLALGGPGADPAPAEHEREDRAACGPGAEHDERRLDVVGAEVEDVADEVDGRA
jgi:DNA-binding CsgD family transcriptional regulator